MYVNEVKAKNDLNQTKLVVKKVLCFSQFLALDLVKKLWQLCAHFSRTAASGSNESDQIRLILFQIDLSLCRSNLDQDIVCSEYA